MWGRGVPVNGSRFDALTRSLAVRGSRRRLLAGLTPGVLGIVGRGRADAVACRTPGQSCRENTNCCSRVCAKDAAGRRVCQCASSADCPPPAACHAVACEDGACAVSVVADQTPCTTPGGAAGTCQGGTCVAPTCAACSTLCDATNPTSCACGACLPHPAFPDASSCCGTCRAA